MSGRPRSSPRSVSKVFARLDPEVQQTMVAIVEVLMGGKGARSMARAKPYIEAARAWRAGLGEGAPFDPETWRELEGIVTGTLPEAAANPPR